MATKPDRWYFSREQLLNSPTIKCGTEPERELSYRQQAANLIQDMGQRLQVYQLCINTAIVYMHRFYMYHSFTKFPRNSIAAAALFLAAKVEEQPHKLEHVIRVSHACLHRGEPPLDPRSNTYAQQAQELVINESIILQTLGFEVGVVHPHTHVVKCTQMIRASKDLSQSSYFLATNSLHLTTFCLKYKPTVVACVCIHLACKWTQWEIPKSNDGKEWWEYVDPSVTEELLNELTREFLRIIDGCPLRLKKRIMGYKQGNSGKDSKKPKTDVPSANDSSQQQPASSSQGSVDSGITTSSSTDAFDYSFDSKPASGFDQYSDSEESKTDEASTQKTEKTSRERNSGTPSAPKMEQPRKQETVKVSLEEYKRKQQKQPQHPSSARPDKPEIASLCANRPLHKESKHSSHKLGASAGLKERVVHVSDKYASGQRNNPSHERTHTGHDRIHHDKFALAQDKQLNASERTVPGHESIHTSQTRGPSGPDRLLLGQERSASSQEKTCPSGGRVPSSSARALGHEKLPSSHRSKPNEKQDAPVTTIDAVKHSLTGDQREKREQKRSEIPIVPTDRSKEIVPTSSAKMAHRSMGEISKEHEEKSYAQTVKGLEWSDKVAKKHRHAQPHPHHIAEFKQTQPERSSKPLQIPEQKESLHEIKQETSQSEQANMDMFNEISAELLNDLKKDSLSSLQSSPLLHPVPECVKREPKISASSVFVPMETPMQNSAAPLGKSHLKPQVEELTGNRELQQAIPPITNLEKRENEDKQDNSERKEGEKRKEGHKSRREDKKHHRSHKHRHHSPSSSRKQGHEVEAAEASGVPGKKQKMEQADSPHTVLTTSKGIKLKIKGLGNSFNNGNDQRNGKEPEKGMNANMDSPSLSLKLTLSKVNSPNTSSPRDSRRDKDPSNHHRAHHKHKSRHHRNKESHHKRPRSPGLSSASDASPVLSPAKKRSADTFDVTKPLPPPNQSLLNLPMPPDLVKARHASPNVKHAKRKRESYPLLPTGGVPPPPPPPQYHPLSTVSGLPPMQYATLDTSVLYGDFQPPLPSGSPMESKPPPPPPLPPPQKRPPLPP